MILNQHGLIQSNATTGATSSFVTDHLLIHLARSSYPNTGTVWNDAQGNFNFNLVGNFSFNNNEITFNGRHINEGGSFATSASTLFLPKNNEPLTIEVYVKSLFQNSGYPLYITKYHIVYGGYDNYSLEFDENKIGFKAVSSYLYNNGNINFHSIISNEANTYYHITMSYDGDVVRLYRNAVLIGTSLGGRRLNSFNTTSLRIMGADINGWWMNVAGSIKAFRLYTKSLSPEEVLLNYNYTLTQ